MCWRRTQRHAFFGLKHSFRTGVLVTAPAVDEVEVCLLTVLWRCRETQEWNLSGGSVSAQLDHMGILQRQLPEGCWGRRRNGGHCGNVRGCSRNVGEAKSALPVIMWVFWNSGGLQGVEGQGGVRDQCLCSRVGFCLCIGAFFAGRGTNSYRCQE